MKEKSQGTHFIQDKIFKKSTCSVMGIWQGKSLGYESVTSKVKRINWSGEQV